MDDKTYGALKRIIEEVKKKRSAECVNFYCVVNDKIGGNDIDLVESWLDETAKEHEGIDIETDPMNGISRDDVLDELTSFVLSVKPLAGDKRLYSTNYGHKSREGIKNSIDSILRLEEPNQTEQCEHDTRNPGGYCIKCGDGRDHS